MSKILTSKGWQDTSDVDVEDGDVTCCDCEEIATKRTHIGNDAYWAQCPECAYETRCQSAEAGARSSYELDYYANRD